MLFIASNREISRRKRQTKARDIYPLLQRTHFGKYVVFASFLCVRFHEY